MSSTIKRIGVFTSGGDAPGMNACLRAVVRTAIQHNLEVYSITRGYEGMIHGKFNPMTSRDVSNIIQRGGTIIKTARSKDFLTAEGRKKAYENLKAFNIDALIAIGGNGTFTGADIFHKEYGIPIVGAPGTIDNDVYGTDYTIGFDTAVNTALESIDKIRDTADALERAFFIEVMGRKAGFIAVQTAIGGGAEMVLIPEYPADFQQVIDTLENGLKESKTSLIVIMAEGFADNEEFTLQIRDRLPNFEFRFTSLGHVQRGGQPTAFDRMLGSRLGIAAVEAVLAGEQSTMVGVKCDQISLTSLQDAAHIHNPVPKEWLKVVEILSK